MDIIAELNRRLPPWRQQKVGTFGPHSGLTPDPRSQSAQEVLGADPNTMPREMRILATEDPLDPKSRIVDWHITMPFAPYVRAIDLQGSLVPLVVGDNRDLEGALGGQMDRILSTKKRQGFLILDEKHMQPVTLVEGTEETTVQPRTFAEYVDLCFKAAQQRKAKQATKAAREREAFRDAHEKVMERKADATLATLATQTDALVKIAQQGQGQHGNDDLARKLEAENADLRRRLDALEKRK